MPSTHYYDYFERINNKLSLQDEWILVKPNLALVYNQLGVVLLEMNKPQEALLHLKKAVELAPDNYIPLGNLGLALSQLGRFDEAVAAIDEITQPLVHRCASIADWFADCIGACSSCFLRLVFFKK